MKDSEAKEGVKVILGRGEYGSGPGWSTNMDKYVGKTATLVSKWSGDVNANAWRVDIDGGGFFWVVSSMTLAEEQEKTPEFKVGDKVVLGHHSGDNLWDNQMEQYVGKVATLVKSRTCGGGEPAYYPAYYVDIDGGRFFWLVESMTLVEDMTLAEKKTEFKKGDKVILHDPIDSALHGKVATLIERESAEWRVQIDDIESLPLDDYGEKDDGVYNWEIQYMTLYNPKPSGHKEDKKMTAKNNTIEGFKNVLTEGTIRATCRQATKRGKQAILKLLSKRGADNSVIRFATDMMDTEVGTGAVSFATGTILPLIPYIKDNEYVQRVAKECQVEGWSVVSGALMDEAMELFGPMIELMSPPAAKRISTAPAETEETEEEEVPVVEKKARGKRHESA